MQILFTVTTQIDGIINLFSSHSLSIFSVPSPSSLPLHPFYMIILFCPWSPTFLHFALSHCPRPSFSLLYFFFLILCPSWPLCPLQSLLELVFGVKVVITGDGFIPGERSVIIMNHRTRLDWMFLWCCLLRYSYLRLEKICLKAVLKAVPGFGGYIAAALPFSLRHNIMDWCTGGIQTCQSSKNTGELNIN